MRTSTEKAKICGTVGGVRKALEGLPDDMTLEATGWDAIVGIRVWKDDDSSIVSVCFDTDPQDSRDEIEIMDEVARDIVEDVWPTEDDEDA